MSKDDKNFYLVREDVLSDSMLKTLQAKLLLESGTVESVREAIDEVGVSRSAFYKYRDTILPFHTMIIEQIVTLSVHLEDRSGALSRVLSTVASLGCNLLTINQTIPLQGYATVILTMEIGETNLRLSNLLEKIKDIEAVNNAEIIGSGA
ncbi:MULTISPECIES: ACT domain-containing protein [Bacillales]|uniref:ACT domain-containing protein n=1 Tax=Bacillales TaxID=1385 RepID=UPI001883D487|nr:ACT domain-containing protein [Pseudalkalibacillus hwajinpoensis]MBF0706387.1 ACT domain-containing protein [Pseudalkalibacillus hwajinpoensis]WLR60704.1 ACT domain-containing protein [Pseudalkalibacillus hwajinpoensis]